MKRLAICISLFLAITAPAFGAQRKIAFERRDNVWGELAVGIVLQKKVGDRVEAGEALATVHARTEEAARQVTSRVAAAFLLSAPAQPRRLLLRRVTAAGIERLDT